MECKNCFRPFNLVANDPRTLSCGHSFCLECVEKLAKDAKDKPIACPVCAKPTAIPSTAKTPLDASFAINENYAIAESMLTIPPNAIAAMKAPCSRKKCTDDATQYCVDCKRSMCPACVAFHNYFCLGHKVVPIAKYLAVAKSNDELAKKSKERVAEVEKMKKEKEAKEKEEKERKERERNERIERARKEKEERERKEREERERKEREERERKEREERERKEREERERKEREERERKAREERERKEREERERKNKKRTRRKNKKRKKRKRRKIRKRKKRKRRKIRKRKRK